tara:strand:- start:770 stop:943 length:174 start_codon:yes stop_codon:yes gene_type:complete
MTKKSKKINFCSKKVAKKIEDRYLTPSFLDRVNLVHQIYIQKNNKYKSWLNDNSIKK